MRGVAFLLASLSGGLGLSACLPEVAEQSGTCQVEAQSVVDCRVEGYVDDELLDVGLVGYSCTGGARPDTNATYSEGVPSGLLCANGEPLENGSDTYCCTPEPVECAYDPSSDCNAPEYGYQCWGGNRPESLNPAIKCGNGNREDDETNYCCSGTPEEPPCQQSDVAGCDTGLLGFLCQGDGHPRGENLGANKSRPDYYHFTCATPSPAPNPEYKTYCCFTPPLVLEGGSCVNHTAVPGCEPGRFGYACYGPDTPEDDFLAMDCPEPGFSGTSQQGYAATLYCCDYIE